MSADRSVEPLVSVCIPSYNAERHVRRCIESVLEQDVDGLEIIVSDDASTDRTWDVVQELLDADPRATLMRQPANLGAAGNWRAVLERARGRYVKLLCSDDYLLPGALEAQITAMQSHPDAVIATGRRVIVDDHGRVLLRAVGMRRPGGQLQGDRALRRMVRHGGNPFGEPSAVLLRRDALERAGGFDGRWRYVIDLSGYARLFGVGDLVVVDRVVAAFRVWPEAWSTQLARTQATETHEFHRSLHDGGTGVTQLDRAVGTVAAWLRRHGRTIVRWRSRRSRPS